ncbi:protein PHOSPHATE-INDUCED 1 [Eucalyptus grandis]|uniref:Uncharacterized protein n=2 Tax=Eucalyptus grandis TaxID=71139 RepID=A0ACC3KB54_EUCGR|nr:protein PHOSPHATE-INDUCED 1 [Eucalyptus grandis]KAK3423545.1 hypothetical protein EUGRSUZ_F00356 [Eucalyptus grandis]
MGSPLSLQWLVFYVLLLQLSLPNLCSGSRKLAALYQPPPMVAKYHNGLLLDGDLRVSILWYGKFTPAQKSIVSDFLLSLTPQQTQHQPPPSVPSAAKWWSTVQTYLQKAGKKQTRVALASQLDDESCSMGKLLKRAQITELAQKLSSRPGAGAGELALVLTAQDVAVESFCVSGCGTHGSVGRQAFIWVGDSASQCPGQCAWPFHQPIYGPQSPPLVAPNGDVGADGMVINVASLLAGTVTNPFGDGYTAGAPGAPTDVASACTGSFGKGSYPGYAGELLVESGTGASYNAEGVNGRKYLLPALFDPTKSQCATVV